MGLAEWWDAHAVPRLIRCACGQPAIAHLREKIVPLARGVADKVDPALRALEQSKLMGTTDPDTQDAMLALAREIFK